ncbi:MAG TPA: hypothetical protein VLT84_09225 [Acidobacteriota bacterium]|nr:hypothetical protein [Acidobacteriota bacterium]
MIPLRGVRVVCLLRALAGPSLLLVLATADPPVSRAEGAAESPLRAGAWALEFELDPEYQYGFGISSAATLSAKRMLSDRSGLRFGVTFGFSDQDRDGERITNRVDPTIPGGAMTRQPVRSASESHAYGAFVHWARHYPVREGLSIHWSLGPTFRYVENGYIEDYSSVYSYTYLRDNVTQRGVFVDARVGFEWFFTRRLSLGARWGAYGGYQWGSSSSFSQYQTADGLYSDSIQRFQSLDRTDIYATRATVSFSAYL